MRKSGFTLIELLVVITIIGILTGAALVAMGGARSSGRDGKRKADLEHIRGGLEQYKSDCKQYPAALTAGSPLKGDGSSTACSSSNTYITLVPKDPQDPTRTYKYSRLTTTTYEMCTSLEGGSGSVTCGGSSSCGSSTCNNKVTSP